MTEYLKVVGVVHVFSLDAVSRTHSPVLFVDGSSTYMVIGSIRCVLEGKLIRELAWRGFLSTDDPVEPSTERGLARGGGCWEKTYCYE